MEHSVFVQRLQNRTHFWGVRRLYAAVHTVFGNKGIAWIVLETLLILTPCLGLSIYGLVATRYGLFVWCTLALLGYLAGSPNPTAIGMVTCMALAIGGIVTSFFAGLPHAIGGLSIGFTWLSACCIQGMALQNLEDAIVQSPENFEKLRKQDNLLMEPR